MIPDPATIDPAEAMLAELAGLDLSLARHVHACAMCTEEPAEVAELSRAYQRIARSLRQSLALHARFKREREAREAIRTPARADSPRSRERKAAVRSAVRRLIWSEHERAEAEDLFERLDHHLQDDDACPAGEPEPLDAQVIRVCRALGLANTSVWRELPDPPPQVTPADRYESSA